jgi:hypothetical protein
VAAWWRARKELETELASMDSAGPGLLAEAGAALWWAEEREGRLLITTGEGQHVW